jgi:protein OS-9
MKSIRQFHQERDLPVRPQDEFFLGKYVEGNEESSHLGTEPKYYSQMYTDGTVCDLSGSKRVTEVRFTCGNEKQMSAITDIKVICFSFCTYFK